MEAFIGTWKLVQDVNYDSYLRATGAGEEMIAITNVLKPVVTISQDDSIVVITRKSGLGTEEVSFTLGREFKREEKDGRYCKVTVELEENQLVQVEKWDNEEAIAVCEVKDGKLIKTITFQGITAMRTFEKV
ncbi:fatty acid-binding protein, brain-like [Neoarius graeffei]|uniref:fatty acid-binding protein, brain-like n=1 Tax=Neoarius graeffei TaxID=443677 RepID=UPI00298D052C|nr:fatty acid-binding protein, brain-like [Neoarius graeffei]